MTSRKNIVAVVFLLFVAALTKAPAQEAPPAKQAPPAPEVPAAQDAPPVQEAAAKKLSKADYYELFEMFVDTLDNIERNYVHEVSRRELVEAAIDGMVGRLDPHSSFISQKDVDRFRSSVENKFGGIGIHVTIEKGQLLVISPLVGAPAYRVGVLAGDHIIEIEGQSTEGIALDEAVRKLKGDVGTDVNITVRQGFAGKPRPVKITRDIVRVETVLGDHRKDDDSWDFLADQERAIGYIRVNSFGRDTAPELRRTLEELKKNQLRGLVLDLRFNPGGLLSSAIEVSDLFISKGRIVSTKGRNTKERTWDAKVAGTFEGFPMAILVNQYSASASEIVSACLQDHERAVIVGNRSFGKGSVQNVIDLEHGKSVLKLTTASYQRPNGKNIHRFPNAKDSEDWGVMPNENFEVKLSAQETRDLMEHRRKQLIARGKPKIEETEQPPSDSEGSADDKPAEDESKKDEPPTEKPKDNDKSDEKGDEKSDDAESDSNEDAPQEEAGGEDEAQPDEKAKVFVDRQLQRALEYLSSELARAE